MHRASDTPTAADAARLRALRRMQHIATALFVVVTVVFLFARWLERDHSGLGYLRAFAEAAMVGALADWFAVTALFRHPLGVPIPHTAIIPHRKDQIGAALGEFVQENFLTEQVLHDRLVGAQIGKRVGVWLADDQHAASAGEAVADAIRAGLEVIDDRDVGPALEAVVERRVRSMAVAPLVGRALDVAIDGGHDREAIDAALSGLRTFLTDHRTTFRKQLEERSPWWIPEPIDERIFSKIWNGVQDFLNEVAGNPNHAVRKEIEQRLTALALRLRTDPALLAKGEELTNELLAHPEVRDWLRSLWGDVKASTMRAAAEPTSELRVRLDASLAGLGRRIAGDAALQAKIDDWVLRLVGHVLHRYRGEVAELIASTVARWDAKATGDRLELQVGRDLQFIRINGTIVGGLAGLVIYSVSQLLF